MIGYFSVITWGITCFNCISFEWQLVNVHLIRDSEICEQSCCEGGLVKWYDSHKQILSVDNEMLIFHQLYDLYELHYLTGPPSLHLSNEMPPSTCCKWFTFFHSNTSHSPLQPIAQHNDSYHLSLRFYNLNNWWVLDIRCCGLIIIYLPPLKLRPTIIINDNFFLLSKVSACNWVSFAKKDSKCHLRENLKAR